MPFLCIAMNCLRSLPSLLLSLALIGGLGACTAPVAHVRVVFQVDDGGQCRMNGQAVPCPQAGADAIGRWAVDQIHAVLLPSPHAPQAAVQALDESLREAHIAHVQFGDPSTFKYDPNEHGFHI